ncbi:MAG TPA: hypothetical protein VD968_19055 [Pyrinomonadaceae bacterium]|nr:hypothetical protein [Pyrinomonadaceae bacterium]
MEDLDDIMGKIGDTSGKIGDTSGKIGDTSGKIGDTSGRTMGELEREISRGRLSERVGFLESRVGRLEADIIKIAVMLDARLRALEGRGRNTEVEDAVAGLVTKKLQPLDEQVQRLERAVKALQAKPPGPGPA